MSSGGQSEEPPASDADPDPAAGPPQVCQAEAPELLDLRRRALLALLPLSTGAAVLVTILVVHDSLLIPTLLLVAGAGVTAVAAVRGLSGEHRALLVARVRSGLLAGALATIVYDLVRYVLVALLDWSVDPFAAFPLFGRLLIGADRPDVLLWLAGTVFHVLNGLGFAVGYTLVVLRPRVLTAVAWAMVLELFTILLYPDWLGVRAVDELFSMSMVGHLAYGIVLGQVAIRASRASGSRHRGRA